MTQVFIGGASSDIGLALCRQYLSHGYKVIAHYCNGQPDFFSLVERSSQITALQIDFADPKNLERMIVKNNKIFLATDVIVCAQGLLDPAPFSVITAEAIWRSMVVNLVPGLLLMRTVVPAMINRGWGRVVHVSSIGVKFGGSKSSFCYALSKHATELMPSDHKIWAANDVFVNTLRIGVTDTRIHRRDVNKSMHDRIALIPCGRMATPEEIAKAIFWYGSEENTFTTGQVVTIAGGE
ncbi:MAG: SDR family oxidoreductase [bacterium]|nr:SDR family oxidoreductase [bacterium]